MAAQLLHCLSKVDSTSAFDRIGKCWSGAEGHPELFQAVCSHLQELFHHEENISVDAEDPVMVGELPDVLSNDNPDLKRICWRLRWCMRRWVGLKRDRKVFGRSSRPPQVKSEDVEPWRWFCDVTSVQFSFVVFGKCTKNVTKIFCVFLHVFF